MELDLINLEESGALNFRGQLQILEKLDEKLRERGKPKVIRGRQFINQMTYLRDGANIYDLEMELDPDFKRRP